MSLENDIFNNPLEAFPEFIDEPAAAPVQTVNSDKVQDTASTTQEATTPELNDIDDSVPVSSPETSVMEEVSLDDFLSDTPSVTEEVDLDAFLGPDSGSPSPSAAGGANVTEEISLDDFGVDFGGGFDAAAIDSFASSSRQEKSDIENAPAIDMELEFDDDFVLETRANPEDDIDFDFEALMASGASAEIPQHAATGDEIFDDFDNIFNNIVDEGAPSAATAGSGIEFDPSAIEEISLDEFGLGDGSSSAPSAPHAEGVSEQQIVYDEVSEFDDLLSSFSDETHVEVADNRKSESKAGPHDYNIIVIMEDDDDYSIPKAPVIEESAEEEDFEVSIFASTADAERFRNHQIVMPQQSFETSGPADDVPVSINIDSDSFEDISLDDFGVTFEDETPAEKPEAPAEASSEQEAAAEAEVETEPETEVEPESEPESETEETPVSDDIPENLEMPDIEDITLPSYEEDDMSVTGEFVPEEIPATPAEEPAEQLEEDMSEEASDPLTQCEDTTIDDKIIVELSEDCVYNGDNAEYTIGMTDGNNEENSDTMDSMNEGLLEKIVSELSVLRNEMQTLRDEVQTLKGGEPAAVETDAVPAAQEDDFAPIPEEPVSEDAVSEEIPIPEADPFAAPQEAGGFFSGDDDDETIALSGDELNNILNSADFTQEDGSNFGMEVPEGSVLPEGFDEDFALDVPSEEEAPAEEAVADEFAIDETQAEEAPAEESVADDFAIDEAPAEEAPAEEAPADDFDINFDEPAVEETAPATEEAAIDDFSLDEPAVSADDEFTIPEETTEDISIDDFNTDLPSLKDESVQEEAVTEEPVADEFAIDETPAEEPVADEFAIDETPAEDSPVEESIADAPAEDDFSLDDLDIPEPSVDESSIVDIDIDEPEEPAVEETAPESFSLDEFDIPEPSVDESSIADIDIDEPSSDIPSDEPVETETTPEADADSDFYTNSDSPAIPEDDMAAIDIQENLEEPVLDDIDFGVDEPQTEDIEIPTGDSLVVDSSSTDFLEEEDPTLEEQLTSEKVDYLNEEAAVDDLGAIPEVEEPAAVEGMEDSLEADTLATSEDETPADDVFSSQWDAMPSEEEVPAEDEVVQASKSFDDPVSFDMDVPETEEDFSLDEPAADIPSDEPDVSMEEPAGDSFDAIADYEEPAAEAAPALDSDIKQEVKSVLKYMDQLLENLPEDKIAEFAQSEHFETYKKLFNELGLV